MSEDHRAGLGLDREHEEIDRRAGRRVRRPALFLWSTRDDLESLYGDPLSFWRPWADHIRRARIESGHHMAEDNPTNLTTALVDFLRPDASDLLAAPVQG